MATVLFLLIYALSPLFPPSPAPEPPNVMTSAAPPPLFPPPYQPSYVMTSAGQLNPPPLPTSPLPCPFTSPNPPLLHVPPNVVTRKSVIPYDGVLLALGRKCSPWLPAKCSCAPAHACVHARCVGGPCHAMPCMGLSTEPQI